MLAGGTQHPLRRLYACAGEKKEILYIECWSELSNTPIHPPYLSPSLTFKSASSPSNPARRQSTCTSSWTLTRLHSFSKSLPQSHGMPNTHPRPHFAVASLAYDTRVFARVLANRKWPLSPRSLDSRRTPARELFLSVRRKECSWTPGCSILYSEVV